SSWFPSPKPPAIRTMPLRSRVAVCPARAVVKLPAAVKEVLVGAGGLVGGLTPVEAALPPHPARNKRLTVPKITSTLISTALLFIPPSGRVGMWWNSANARQPLRKLAAGSMDAE